MVPCQACRAAGRVWHRHERAVSPPAIPSVYAPAWLELPAPAPFLHMWPIPMLVRLACLAARLRMVCTCGEGARGK